MNMQDSDLCRAITRHLTDKIEEIRIEETKAAIASASKRIEERTRELLPQVAMKLLNRFSVERPFGGHELVIKIDLKPDEASNSNRQLP